MKRAFAVLLVLFLALSFASAGTAAKRMAPKLPKSYLADLHVAGGVTVTSTHDTLGECSPGQAWTMIEKADLVINDVVRVTHFGNVVTSTFARDPGAVSQKSRIRNYRSTNYCPPTQPTKLVKPKCRTITALGLANLVPDPRRNGKVSIGITRRGGKQDLSCIGPVVDSTPMGSAVTTLQLPLTPISLPLGLNAGEFKRLKPGKTLISRSEIAGRCKFAVVAPLRNRNLNKAAEDSCDVEGVFNVTVKRIGE